MVENKRRPPRAYCRVDEAGRRYPAGTHHATALRPRGGRGGINFDAHGRPFRLMLPARRGNVQMAVNAQQQDLK